MKKICLLLCFVLCFTFVGCENSNVKSVESIETEEKVDEDAMTDFEQEVFDILIENINGFKNPTSVKILGTHTYTHWDEQERDEVVILNIQADTDIGSNSSYYNLRIEDNFLGSKGDFEEQKPNFKNLIDNPDLSTKKFNLALKKHWEDLGLGE